MSAPQMVSKHFSLDEVSFSATAARMGIDNTPSSPIIAELVRVCEELLEPIRAEFGPLRVTSGYRCPELNLHVPGSARDSPHIYGCAIDFVPFIHGHRLKDIVEWIVQSPLNFDQVIYEYGRWVHVACSKPGYRGTERHQALMKFADEPMARTFDPTDHRVRA